MRLSSAAVALTAAVFNSVLSPLNAQVTDVFINEFHYNNVGGDVGEFVEIAGPAGTVLDGWSLTFYDGISKKPYPTETFTVPLSGTIPCKSGGFGTVLVDTDPLFGFQNDNEGVCLHVGTDVVQFLSYGDIGGNGFVADGGACDGMTSTDIGVAESGSTTQIGESLQLTGGPGTQYGDFVWVAPLSESPGLINDGQTFGDLCPGEVNCEECDTGGADKIQVCNKNNKVICVAEEAFFNNFASDIVAACGCYP